MLLARNQSCADCKTALSSLVKAPLQVGGSHAADDVDERCQSDDVAHGVEATTSHGGMS